MQQNCKVVLDNIMNNYAEQVSSRDEIRAKDISLIMRRLFLKYSDCSG